LNSRMDIPHHSLAPQASLGTEDIDFRGLVMMLWRQKIIILSVLFLGLGAAVFLVGFLKPLYTGHALLLIDQNPGSSYPREFEALFSSIRSDGSATLTQIEVIRSRNLAKKIVVAHNLMTDPELNPRFQNLSAVDPEKEGADFKSLSVYKNEMGRLSAGVIDRELADVVSRFLKRLTVRSVPGSNAIQVSYASRDPERSALVTNAVVDSYIEQRLALKSSSSRKLNEWLDGRLSELRAQVRVKEEQVVAYREAHNIVGGASGGSAGGALAQIQDQVAAAKSVRLDAETRLEQVQGLANNISRIETVPGVFNADIVQRLKITVSQQERNLEDLQSRYGAKHPNIIQAKAELEAAQSALRDEIRKTVAGIRNEVELAQARVETLEFEFDQASGESFSDGGALIRLRELEQDAAATRAIYATFLETQKKSDAQEQLQEPEARVISYAVVPHAPSYPNNMLILSLSGVVSLFIGLAIAIILEKLDNTFRTGSQLEQAMARPCFGMIPSVKVKDKKEAGQFVLTKPSSTLAESVKSLRTALNLRHLVEDRPIKVVTMTSSFPGEGKTTLSTWLGRVAAKSGEKVLLIDADLRRPNLHRLMALPDEGNLVDYLTGQKKLEDVIQKDDATGMDCIRGVAVPNSALDLISGDKMKALVESLRGQYDLIILDSPACLAVSDSAVLATLSDIALYTVEWDTTPREVVINGVKQFTDMGYDRLVFVLSNVDVKKHVRYGYGDSVYYFGRYKEYYTS